MSKRSSMLVCWWLGHNWDKHSGFGAYHNYRPLRGDGNASTDKPVVGDWSGDGTTTIGVVRNTSGNWEWLLRNSNSAGSPAYDFDYGNASTDTPIVGNWDEESATAADTVGVVRPDCS